MDKDKLIEEMLKDMGDKNNTIDLNAYGRGLIDMYDRLVKNCSIPAVLIDEIIKYIEETEETIDGEWGACRSVEELIEDNCMPELYAKMLALKNGR